MTREEYENTLRDLLALSRLQIQEMLPADGRVSGFEKIADGLDLSPAHLAAYAAAAENALTAAIATRSTPPPVFKRRIYPAGLFKFGGNLVSGNFVLLKDGKPERVAIVTGITDGSFTEVVSGLDEGALVVTDRTSGAKGSGGAGAKPSTAGMGRMF